VYALTAVAITALDDGSRRGDGCPMRSEPAVIFCIGCYGPD
jgi:hypothetical protein